ncbi:MAG: proprotein convertase P-domain-containing protein [Marinirhabdus sp.]|nr:proprotein convertase P-domain-containing protein [Marinirhabdus sp.]
MKKITLAFMVMALMCFTWQTEAQTYSGGGNPQPVPATGTGGFPCVGGPTISDAAVPIMGTIGMGPGEYVIDNVTLNITHTWDADMDITLIAPSGTTLDLSSDNGGSGDNYTDTVFMDGAPSITTGSAPFTGTFQAEGGTFAATFAGEATNGNWSLSICDDAGGDSGTLNSYAITFSQNSTMVGDPPMIFCPADIVESADPGVCGGVVNFAGVATDTEDGNISGSITSSPLNSGDVFPVGTTTVTLSVTDSDGNTSTCDFDVTITDDEVPTMTCPADITQTNDPGECGAIVTVPMPNIMDNCPLAPPTSSPVTVTGPVTDYNFNTAGLIDTPTTLTAPQSATGDVVVSVTYDGDHGASTEEFRLAGPDGTEVLNEISGTDCALVNTSFTVDAGTWNSWIANFGPDLTFVLLEDGAVDVFTCNNQFQLEANYLTGSGLINDYNGTDDASGFYPVGDTDVTFTYTDEGGNSVSCTMTVTVTDDEAPAIVCAGDPAPLTGSASDAPGVAIPDSPAAGLTTTIDIVDDFNISDLNVDLDISHTWVGDLIITLEAPDGTSAVLAERIGAAPGSGGFGCSGNDILATLDDEATGGAINDACITANVPAVNGTFTPENPLSVFDGISTLGTWTLTISDNAGGDTGTLNSWALNYEYTAISNPLEVVLDANGMATVDAADLLIGFSDNCGIASTTVDQTGAPAPGSITTIFETNNNGAAGGAIYFDITVGPLDINISDLDLNTAEPGAFTVEMYTLVGTHVGNEANPGAWTLSATGSGTAAGSTDVPSNAVLDAPVTLTANETYGVALVLDAAHSHYYSGTGTNPAPGMTTYSNADLTLNLGSATNVPFSGTPFSPRIWNGTLNYETAGGTAAVSMFDVDCEDVGENTIEVTVTDVNGNVSTCTATYIVIDDLDPDLVCQDFTLELGPDGTAVLDAFDMIDLNASFDACGIATAATDLVNFTCDDIGDPIEIVVFGADPSGNAASCTAFVTVVDATGPEVTCPADQTVDPGANNQFYQVPDYFGDGLASAVDNCTDPVTIFSQDPAPGALIPDGVYTVTLSATDEYGNVGTCTFELTVESILGVNDNNLDAGITMYPNPAQGQVTIANSSNINLERLTMYDVNGKLVNTTDLSDMQGEQTIDIANLASGVYIVQIESENASVVKRLIKE